MTPQQKACRDFIASRLSASGVAPSFEEIARALGLKSKSGVHRLITALERDGEIRRRPYGVRAIYIPAFDEKLPADIRADASRIASARRMSVEAVIRSALQQYDRSAA